ncbi:MAG: DMT family transporter [Balneolaceae bacterium]
MSETAHTGDETPIAKVLLLLFVGLLTFGFAPILVRFATDVEPLVLAALRTGFAVLLLTPFWFWKKKPIGQLKQYGVHHWMLIAAGIALGLHFSLWIASLHYTSVASASVLVTMHPVMLIVAERLLFKRIFAPVIWVGVLLSFFGSALLGLADDAGLEQFPNALLGNGLAFSAAILFVVYFLFGRKIRQHAEWIDYVYYVYGYAALTCIIGAFFWVGGWPAISTTGWVVGFLLAAGPTILGHGSMNYAVKYVSPTLLSTLILSEVVFAAIVAYFLFQEVPTTLSFAAMAIILFGVSLTWLKRTKTMRKR